MTTIVETTRIAERPDALWHEIGRFGAVGEWHPLLDKVESEGEREGCRRTAEAKDGSRQTERLFETDAEQHFYRYGIESTTMPVRDYVAEFKVQDNHDGTSTVVWLAEFQPEADEPKATEAIRDFLRTGLNNLAAVHGK
ncbi:SRPBCC family protein [Mesorhizobium opportunistum]|uniref:Polyketide cyclase/dehydrase n=1 Tax=Mesorhizobium opportunistum (strain LMG 24607 / HAMBI 3007 / WSM2075) TaxID=536019 RepID=F7Y6D2_MESOW|nr:SRPBCC family protein [Mesorhizobium opportunistum]AEH90818.1 Polyketide cyclase/dehydrase [Mesorhizobium opportunistum WSM2075]